VELTVVQQSRLVRFSGRTWLAQKPPQTMAGAYSSHLLNASSVDSNAYPERLLWARNDGQC